MKLILKTLVTGAIGLPTVMWHGMGDHAESNAMRHIKNMILDNTDNNHVVSIKIGETASEDRQNGFRMPIWDQIAIACDIITSDPKLKDGYHGLGLSQGSQFLRAIVQTCPGPQMVNLVTIDGQHQGVFGFPSCPPDSFEFCEVLRDLLEIAYQPEVQDSLVQAQYWHDTTQKDLHRRMSQFIAPINNDFREGTPHIEEYKENLNKLENLVLVMGSKDQDTTDDRRAMKFDIRKKVESTYTDSSGIPVKDIVVIPRETSHFGFYRDGTNQPVVEMEETNLYEDDLLGLKKMNEDGKIHRYVHEGHHMSFSDEFFLEYIIPFLQ